MRTRTKFSTGDGLGKACTSSGSFGGSGSGKISARAAGPSRASTSAEAFQPPFCSYKTCDIVQLALDHFGPSVSPSVYIHRPGSLRPPSLQGPRVRALSQGAAAACGVYGARSSLRSPRETRPLRRRTRRLVGRVGLAVRDSPSLRVCLTVRGGCVPYVMQLPVVKALHASGEHTDFA